MTRVAAVEMCAGAALMQEKADEMKARAHFALVLVAARMETDRRLGGMELLDSA